MVSLIELLDSARSAGLTWHQEGERLIVRGPRSAGDIVKQLLARKAEVFSTITPLSPTIVNEVADDPIPGAIIESYFERTTSADGSLDWKLFPLFARKPTALAPCNWCHECRWWRSIFGTHLICGVCHAPQFNHVVAEWLSPDSFTASN